MPAFRFRRLFICALDVDRALLQSAARLAALTPAADLHVVAGTAPHVLETLPGAVAEAFGRVASRVRLQLVPEPSLRAFHQLAGAEGADLMVVPAGLAGQGRGAAPCSTMVLPASSFADNGNGVIALVNWEGGAATLATAVDMARRMRQPRVTVCHVYFNEAAIACDEWEAREARRRRRTLDLLIARVANGDVDIEAHVIQCPDLQRALTRPELPRVPDIIVSSEPVRAEVPVLALQVASPSGDAASRRRAWDLLRQEVLSPES